MWTENLSAWIFNWSEICPVPSSDVDLIFHASVQQPINTSRCKREFRYMGKMKEIFIDSFFKNKIMI